MATDHLLGVRIARRRHVLGLTQAELAAEVGVGKSTVVAWENGHHFPKRKLGKLEAVLGITLNDDGDRDGMDTIEQDVKAARGLSERQKAAILDLLQQDHR